MIEIPRMAALKLLQSSSETARKTMADLIVLRRKLQTFLSPDLDIARIWPEILESYEVVQLLARRAI